MCPFKVRYTSKPLKSSWFPIKYDLARFGVCSTVLESLISFNFLLIDFGVLKILKSNILKYNKKTALKYH